jgi:ubiquinone/menaquinone biosynthesis C-methylase UbiE
MTDAAQLAQSHWNETPLLSNEQERYSEYRWLYDVAEFQKHAGHKVLEIGCGTGTDLLQFVKHGAIATGIDLASSHVDLARNRVGELARVYQADMRHLPFANDSFDYVYSHGVLHHSDEPEKAVREMFRVLRPGGRINIHVYAFWSYFTLWRFLRYGGKWKSHIEHSPAPVHIDLYTERKLRKLFGATASIEKHQCRPFEFLAPWFGWYLVVKDQKSLE